MVTEPMTLRYSDPVVSKNIGEDSTNRYKIVIAATDDGVDLSRMDVNSRYAANPVILFAHDHQIPIGKTIRGPYREDGRWVAEFQFAENDPTAERLRNLYDQGILNAASIGFYEIEEDSGVKYPLLVEWSLVVVGMDKLALAMRQLDNQIVDLEKQMNSSNESEVRDIEVSQEETSEIEEETIESQEEEEEVAEVEEEEEEEESSEETPEEEVAEDEVEEESSELSPDREQSADWITRDQAADMVKSALDREKLVTRTKDLLPGDFDPDQASTRELLVLAVGNEVSDIDQRSNDYLLGRVDAILERRSRGITLNKATMIIESERSRPRNINELKKLIREG